MAVNNVLQSNALTSTAAPSISSFSPSERIADVIEYGRALFASLSFRSSNAAREVHVLRLRAAFDRATLTHSLRYVLGVLSLTREIQELKGG